MARGGKREGAGRPRGQRSAATKDQIAGISELARMHSETALSALVQIASQGASEAARVSAANSILDRAFGRPLQAVEMSGPDGGPVQTIDVSKLSTGTLREIMRAQNEAPDADGG